MTMSRYSQQTAGGNQRTAVIGHRIGGWLPQRQETLDNWLDKKITLVRSPALRDVPLHPVLQDFQRFIEKDPVIYMGFHQMFEQVPNVPLYDKGPDDKQQVRDYKLMLRLFNTIITTAPSYEDGDLVGFPINAILNYPMSTTAGMAVFARPDVNAHFKAMFDVWSAFLTSPDSRTVLDDSADGWFGPEASQMMPLFKETYVCDPSAPYHGFKSWDDFFTRPFVPGVRSVLFPDHDGIVNSACESTVYRIATNVNETDSFWLKGQLYSLAHMLNHDDSVSQFVGGTVYQAFLSATKYHRWHAPVNGTITRVVNVPGTYYVVSPYEGFPDPDPAGPNLSQAFITAMAARAIIYIQADNPVIGLLAFIAVGMAEVSTCEVTVEEGATVKKGDQLGIFHFGGSTHCLVFGPQVVVTFDPDVAAVNQNVRLNQPIATVAAASAGAFTQ
ncbi:Phophatidylserine decarboxylase-domain-containing protein [Trametes polyzona]|nr:Phophatidylserine decarboxylase-domain-containing protein [Trametes polyzona]